MFLEDGKDGDVFVTVDDCNGCTWDGENENNLHPEELVLFDDLLVESKSRDFDTPEHKMIEKQIQSIHWSICLKLHLRNK